MAKQDSLSSVRPVLSLVEKEFAKTFGQGIMRKGKLDLFFSILTHPNRSLSFHAKTCKKDSSQAKREIRNFVKHGFVVEEIGKDKRTIVFICAEPSDDNIFYSVCKKLLAVYAQNNGDVKKYVKDLQKMKQ